MSTKRRILDPKIKSFPLIIFTIVIAIAINSYFFKVEYDNTMESMGVINLRKEDLKTEIVIDAVEKQYDILKSDSKYISKKIEAAIIKEYRLDIEVLKNELDSNTFSERLFNVLKTEIVSDSKTPNKTLGNNSYNYVLGFSDGIFASFKNINETISVNEENKISWQDYFARNGKSTLSESLVNNILNKDVENKILLNQINVNKESSISTHGIKSIEKIYNEFGLEGLKNIEFVTVSYITEEGDIFNTDDYTYLEKNDNYKMILVESTNVYDTIIKDVKPEINMCDEQMNNILKSIDDEVTRDSLGFITTNGLLIMIVLIFSMFYNKNYEKDPL